MDYDTYCEQLGEDEVREAELAEERADEAAELRSLELAHIEGMLEAIDDAVCDALADLEVNAPLTFVQRNRLWSALHGFCNDGLFLAEASQLRAAS